LFFQPPNAGVRHPYQFPAFLDAGLAVGVVVHGDPGIDAADHEVADGFSLDGDDAAVVLLHVLDEAAYLDRILGAGCPDADGRADRRSYEHDQYHGGG
jgi:hypothetical protein